MNRDIDFVGMLQLDHLEILGLLLLSHSDRDSIVRILKHGGNASELWLRDHHSCKTVLPLLIESSPRQGKSDQQPTEHLLLPELRRINANLEDRRPSQDLLSRFRSLLNRRSKLTNGPLSLALVNSRIDKPEDLEKLRKAAGQTELVQVLDDRGASGEDYFILSNVDKEPEIIDSPHS
ncbi:hypothetical protein PUNSTDRAFT_135304 [Punctularia strigosozonata HHB-11173 SS5]|uniref:uncharacterized protein n=1 Tax=Punctularia strigosozonata (strain HHB-11173) TaxID=741275 RepID=UPI0004416A17|nr:uncharacterized protein PUNSTDRAFT_135304 [Punctularia strigosozonata HHB-11173 SS5]EIN07785.1 hypothetical protein PUNSTDRAFT_135304 [Punctularia strigosozonata HHB-11173 SS5]